MTVSSSWREDSSSAPCESSAVMDALIEVSGVRSSWVTESSSAVRRRSVSLAASERALDSRAPARSMEMETRPLSASMVSRESEVASSSSAPLGRTPMRSGIATGQPSAGGRKSGCIMASRRSRTISERVRSMQAGAVDEAAPLGPVVGHATLGLEMYLGSER